MKNRLIIVLLTIILVLNLSACGNKKTTAPSSTAAPQITQEPAVTETPAQDLPVVETEGEIVLNEESDPVKIAFETALSLKEHDVQELYDAIGEPESSDYASSCLVDGEDGALYYNGFTVYTLRTADGETVYDAELN